MKEDQILTRDQVFDILEHYGVKEASVPYKGSSDESTIEGHDLDPAPEGWAPDEALEAALEQPIYDKIGEDFGDGVPGVEGIVVWNVTDRTIKVHHSYLHWNQEEINA